MPASWKGKQVTLSLERCMWTTALWVDGTLVGEANSLCAPHTYDLTGYLTPGTHTLLITQPSMYKKSATSSSLIAL